MTVKNFDAPFINEEGEPARDKGKFMTMLDLVKTALFTTLPGDADGEEKFKRFELIQRIKTGGEQDMLPEEIVLIKQRAGMALTVNAVGQLYKILNA